MKVSAAAACLLLAGCDVFGPQPTEDVTFTFCRLVSPPEWISLRNTGDEWKGLSAGAMNVNFRATRRFALAFGHGTQSYALYLTTDELRGLSCVPAPQTFAPVVTVQAEVRGLEPDEQFVLLGPRNGGVYGSRDTAFSMTLPAYSEELFAIVSRSGASPTRRRYIARRDLELTNGAVLPPFDFSSSEPVALDSATISVDGIDNWSGWMSNVFSTPEITFGLTAVVNATLPYYYALPAAVQRESDDHVVHVAQTNSVGNSERELWYFYDRVRDTSLAMGPLLAVPAAQLVDRRPCLRLRALLPVQHEYSSYVTVNFVSSPPTPGPATVVSVTVTRKYVGGTPGTWKITSPDARRPSGACLLDQWPGGRWSFNITANHGRVGLFLGDRGRDGELRRMATRFSLSYE